MSYFDDNEDRVVYGRNRSTQRRHSRSAENFSRTALAAPPGSALAKARIAAHAAFDPLWKSGQFSRGVAYEWLAGEMGLSVKDTHMILFDIEQCQRVVAICEAHPACNKAAFDLAANDFEALG